MVQRCNTQQVRQLPQILKCYSKRASYSPHLNIEQRKSSPSSASQNEQVSTHRASLLSPSRHRIFFFSQSEFFFFSFAVTGVNMDSATSSEGTSNRILAIWFKSHAASSEGAKHHFLSPPSMPSPSCAASSEGANPNCTQHQSLLSLWFYQSVFTMLRFDSIHLLHLHNMHCEGVLIFPVDHHITSATSSKHQAHDSAFAIKQDWLTSPTASAYFVAIN